jgi:hypothetical protein
MSQDEMEGKREANQAEESSHSESTQLDLIIKKLKMSGEASLLWDEYKYRHDLIWKHLIRSTIAVIALVTVPYSDSFEKNSLFIVSAAILAIGYTIFTAFVISAELKLLRPIKVLHRKRQQYYFDLYKAECRTDQKNELHGRFNRRIWFYISCLLLLAALAGLMHLYRAVGLNWKFVSG